MRFARGAVSWRTSCRSRHLVAQDYHPHLPGGELPQTLLPADPEGRGGDVRAESGLPECLVCQGDGHGVWERVRPHSPHHTTLTILYRDILYIKTVHYVHSLCMKNRLWAAAVVYGQIALPAFRKYYGGSTSQLAALLVRWDPVVS